MQLVERPKPHLLVATSPNSMIRPRPYKQNKELYLLLGDHNQAWDEHIQDLKYIRTSSALQCSRPRNSAP
jgi:hypothetical protein